MNRTLYILALIIGFIFVIYGLFQKVDTGYIITGLGIIVATFILRRWSSG